MADPRVLEGIKKYINNRQRQILVRKAQKEMESEQELNTLLRQTVQTKDGRPQLPAIPTPEEAANLDFPSQEEMGMTDNEYRQFMFEQGVYKDSEGWKQLPADVNIQRRRIYEGEDIPDPNSMYNESGERPAGMLQASAPQENVETKGKTLDTIQSTLDAAGMLSGVLEPVGIGADAVNTLISLGRGNLSDAATSAASMVPIVGLFAKPIKKVRARVRYDEKGRIIKDREYTKAMDSLEQEVNDNIDRGSLNEYIENFGEAPNVDVPNVKKQAQSILKRIRKSKYIQDIESILTKNK